jgi:hypothetical protein
VLNDLPDIETQATYSGGLFFLREVPGYINAYEQGHDTAYLSSPDGQTWESSSVSETEWFGLPARGNQTWVAGGEHGHVAASTNAVEWQISSTGDTNQLLHSTVAGGTFFLTGANGTLLTSVDGTNWSRQFIDSTNTMDPVVWSAGTFAVAEPGTARLFTSSDTVVWTLGSMPADVVLIENLMSWEEGFVALVRTNQYVPGRLMRSTDCRSWFDETVPAVGVDRIATGGDWLLAFRGQGSHTFHARRAGETNWTSHFLPWVTSLGSIVQQAPAGVAFGQDTFLLTHGWQMLLQCDPLTATAPRITQPLAVVTASPATQVTLRATAQGSTPMRYQWLRDGTNLPAATSPFLTLPVGEITSNRITVIVENEFGSAESSAATIVWAEPATLEIAAGLSPLRLHGTPRGRYQIEFTDDISSETAWTVFGEVELPSSAKLVRVKNLLASGWPGSAGRFYRAVARP